LLEAGRHRVGVALAARAPEREHPEPQPLVEPLLLLALVRAGAAQLDDDALAQSLVPRLFADDLADHLAVGQEAALLVFAQLPEPAPVVEELRHRQLEPGARELDRPRPEPRVDDGLDGGADQAL